MKVLYFFVVSLLLSQPLLADVVFLKNGDRLSGSVIRKESDVLVFKTEYAGEVSINWSNITSLSTDAPVRVVLQNDTTVEAATLQQAQDGKAVVSAPQVEQPVVIALDSVKYINPSDIVLGKGVKVSGRINAGISIASGNSDTENYNLDTEVIVRTKENRFTVGAKMYRATDNNVDTEDQSNAYLKYDHFLSEKNYIYGTTSFARDKFKDQKLKSTVGLGYGHQFYESEEMNLALEGGVNYVNDDFYVAADDDYAAGRWAIRFDKMFFKKRLQFFHGHEGLLDLSDTDSVSVTSQTGFRFPILSGMNASLQFNVDWDKTPPPGTKTVDRKLLFNLGYAW